MSTPLPRKQRAHRAEPESLKEQATNSLDESRMVLPGIQAMFGFQLIAIFNEQFQRLDHGLQLTHFASLCLVVLAVALIMTPAAYDRIVDSDYMSEQFLKLTARLMTTAMAAFGFGLATELYVITAVVIRSEFAALTASIVAVLLFAVAWIALPLRERQRITTVRGAK